MIKSPPVFLVELMLKRYHLSESSIKYNFLWYKSTYYVNKKTISPPEVAGRTRCFGSIIISIGIGESGFYENQPRQNEAGISDR
jgi:hypothetical protein